MENNSEVATLKNICKKPKIHVASYWELKKVINPVDVTSHSELAFGKALSPFYLGPVNLYDGHVAHNVENGWQYSKVYKEFIKEKDGDPSEKYFSWAAKGWQQTWADRHPRGKEIPLYSWWAGEKLDYIQARKKIYLPLYAAAARETEAFGALQEYCRRKEEVTLIDFDGYNFEKAGLSIEAVVNNPEKRMGHAFVLWLLLNNIDFSNF